MARPDKSLIVCVTPRSGSSVLCELLRGTGVAGHPDEHLLADSDAALRKRLAVVTDGEVLGALTDRATTPNGVFGLNVGVADGALARLLRLAEAATGDPGIDGLWAVLGRPHFVWVTRRDKIRQALSWWRATVTGRWRAGDPATAPEPDDLDADAVSELVRQLVAREAAWAEFFESAGVVPLTLVYEDWIRRREETLKRVLRFVGVDFPPAFPMDTLNRPQADERTQRWRAAYLRRARPSGDGT